MPSRPLRALVFGLGLWLCEVVVETLLSEVVEAWLEGVGGIRGWRGLEALVALVAIAFVTWWTLHKVDHGEAATDATATPQGAEHQVGEVTLCHACQDQINSPRNKKSLRVATPVDISSIDTEEFHTPLPYKTPSIEKVEAVFIENPKEFVGEDKDKEKEDNVCMTCKDNDDDSPRATMAGLLTINDTHEDSYNPPYDVELLKQVDTMESKAHRIDSRKNYEHAKMVDVPVQVNREKFTVEIPIIRINKEKVESEPL